MLKEYILKKAHYEALIKYIDPYTLYKAREEFYPTF